MKTKARAGAKMFIKGSACRGKNDGGNRCRPFFALVIILSLLMLTISLKALGAHLMNGVRSLSAIAIFIHTKRTHVFINTGCFN
jgi:hypothetical protein